MTHDLSKCLRGRSGAVVKVSLPIINLYLFGFAIGLGWLVFIAASILTTLYGITVQGRDID